MRHECSTLTSLDATLQLGLIWPFGSEGTHPDQDIESIMRFGLADSPTARRLQVLFAEHAAAGQPLAQRIAALCAIARLMIDIGLPETEDAEDRECRDVFHAALEHAQALAAGTATAGSPLEHALCERLERFDWPYFPDTRAASALLNAGHQLADRGGTAWSRAACMLASLAMLVSDENLEPTMQRAAQVVHSCLFPKAG